ncbi:hypothetical protein EDB89DRAFT_1905078 [Lactarius sanguifluus]|nr:hypothetical protein EDB89DRAFT_1905078 [Lactarius sanguifluus]
MTMTVVWSIVCAWCGSRWASVLHGVTREFVKIDAEAEHSEKEDTKACTKPQGTMSRKGTEKGGGRKTAKSRYGLVHARIKQDSDAVLQQWAHSLNPTTVHVPEYRVDQGFGYIACTSPGIPEFPTLRAERLL